MTAEPANVIVVENRSGGVLIRAARDNFSKSRKHCFIRYLAAEGYIPDQYSQGVELDAGFCGLKWLVDESLLKEQSVQSPPVRQVLRVILYASLFWLGLIGFAFLQAPR